MLRPFYFILVHTKKEIIVTYVLYYYIEAYKYVIKRKTEFYNIYLIEATRAKPVASKTRRRRAVINLVMRFPRGGNYPRNSLVT